MSTPESTQSSAARTITIIAGIIALAAVVASVAFYFTTRETYPNGGVRGTATVNKQLAGLDQSGTRLGTITTQVRIHVFADPTSQSGSQFQRDVIPGVIKELIRTKQAQLNYNPIPDSKKKSHEAAHGVLAASAQDKGWKYAELLAANTTGARSSGSEEDLEAIADAAGIDVAAFRSDLENRSDEYESTVRVGRRFADSKGLTGAVSLHIVGPERERVLLSPITLNQIKQAVDEVSP